MFCCQVPSVAVRAEFSHGSEQISQVLLGETVQCLDFHENWVRIRCAWDQYTGWVPSMALREIPDIEEKGLSVLSDYAFVTDHSTNSNLLLSMGSILAPALFPNG
ncbi:MAG: SH3 domain-containing protein, partial [Bacteroidota bacterium]